MDNQALETQVKAVVVAVRKAIEEHPEKGRSSVAVRQGAIEYAREHKMAEFLLAVANNGLEMKVDPDEPFGIRTIDKVVNNL